MISKRLLNSKSSLKQLHDKNIGISKWLGTFSLTNLSISAFTAYADNFSFYGSDFTWVEFILCALITLSITFKKKKKVISWPTGIITTFSKCLKISNKYYPCEKGSLYNLKTKKLFYPTAIGTKRPFSIKSITFLPHLGMFCNIGIIQICIGIVQICVGYKVKNTQLAITVRSTRTHTFQQSHEGT